MAQVFGDFVDFQCQQHQEYLKIRFSPSSIPLQQRWRNNGLSADFLADYLSTFFPGEDGEAQGRQTEIRDAVKFIANELLENAMKFTYAPAQHAVSITIQLGTDNMRFYVSNSLDPAAQAAFQRFIEKLLTQDPAKLYLEQVAANDDEKHSSSLGYVTMLNDYGAKLAWKFGHLAKDPQVPEVTTMVQLPL